LLNSIQIRTLTWSTVTKELTHTDGLTITETYIWVITNAVGIRAAVAQTLQWVVV